MHNFAGQKVVGNLLDELVQINRMFTEYENQEIVGSDQSKSVDDRGINQEGDIEKRITCNEFNGF